MALARLARGARRAGSMARPSRSIVKTDAPIVEKMRTLSKPGVASLAQGIVHWAPPDAAIDAAANAARDPSSHAYGADAGLPELRTALAKKLRAKGLVNAEIMVTAGANQAFANVALTLLDAGDACLLFAPYYFNHKMMLDMRGCRVEVAPTDKRLLPTVEATRTVLDGGATCVVVVNPGNPSGAVIPEERLRALAALCGERGAWLVVDNTYEAFVYGAEHVLVEGPHVVNLFSFSKAYGLMGWRVGYVAYDPALGPEFLKAQDTIAICAAQCSQRAALAALEADADGRWTGSRVAALARAQKTHVLRALAPLGGCVGAADGAIYVIAKLPREDDEAVVEWLANKHGVAVIPGSACGLPGHIRVCYANLDEAACEAACARLEEACVELANGGGPPPS